MDVDFVTVPWAVPLLAGDVDDRRYLIGRGGRARGATTAFGQYHVLQLLKGRNVMCLREYQNSIEDSNIAVMKQIIMEAGLEDHFEVLTHEIRCISSGAHTSFRGCHRNLDALMSISGYPAVWFEQAETLTEESIDILMPSFREPGQTISFSYNPMFEESPIEEFRQGLPEDTTWDVFATWQDNPLFEESGLEVERQRCLTKTPEKYDWIWNGGFRKVGVSNPFGAQSISDAVARETLPARTDDRVSGVDVAYTENGDWTAVVTLDEPGNVVHSWRARIEDPVDRHEAIYENVKGSYRVLVDGTEAAGRMAYQYLRSRGVNATLMTFNRSRKHDWVTYAARRLQEGRATLRGDALVKEARLFTADGLGKYEASSGHDDLVCAWLLGMEGLRQWEKARGGGAPVIRKV